MARIPTAEELGYATPSAGAPLQQISGSEKEQMLEPAKALVDLGQAIGGRGKDGAPGGAIREIGGAIQRFQDAGDDYEATKLKLKFDREQERAYEQAKHEMPPGADGFSDTWRRQYDEAARGLIAEAKQKGIRQASLQGLDQNLLTWGERLHSRAMRDELIERDRFHVDDVQKQLLDIENRVAEKPERVQDMIAASKELLQNSKLPNTQRHALLRKIPAELEKVAARSLIDRDSEGAIDILQRRPTGDTGDVPGDTEKLFSTEQAEALKGVKPAVADRLGALQAAMGTTFKINSATRSPLGNKAVGGVDGSHHLTGNALDIDISGMSPEDRKRLIENASAEGFTGIGIYDTHLHLDMGERRVWGGDKTSKAVPDWAKGLATLHAAGNIKRESGDGENPDAEPIDEGDREPLPQWSFGNDAPFRHLPYMERQKLLNVARINLRDTVATAVKDDIERIRDGKPPVTDANGRTSLDRAGMVMTKNQQAKLKREWDEAGLEARVIAPLKGMSEADAIEHLQKADPGEESDNEGYKARDRVFQKAVRTWDKIQEARKKDFAAAVEDQPEVKQARVLVSNLKASKNEVYTPDDGSPDKLVRRVEGPVKKISAPDAWAPLIEARYKVQRRLLGRPENDTSTDGLRPITRSEAMDLLSLPDDASVDTSNVNKILQAAADKAERRYGPQYARKAFETAAFYLLKVKEEKEDAKTLAKRYWDDANTQARAKLLADKLRGEDVRIEDIRRVKDTDRAAAPVNAIDGTDASSFEIDRSSPRMQMFQKQSLRSQVTPNAQQVDWLKADPKGRAAAFDKMFGPGQAASALAR